MKWTLVLSLLMAGCSVSRKLESQKVTRPPQLIFTLTEGIAHPESVLYSSEHKVLFVSNIVSGNPVETKALGYISMYDPAGKLLASPWVKGLKAPKGLAIVGNMLYVSDVNQVVKIDIEKAKILQAITVPGAKFLNDVVADKLGNVYISDTMTDTIHVWGQDGIKVWKQSSDLRSPNGLYTDGSEHLLMASWGNPIADDFSTKNAGALSTHLFKDLKKPIQEETSIRGNLDGIAGDNQGNLWVSDWLSGDIYKVSMQGSGQKVFNLGRGAADLSFAKDLNLLLVPQMNQNKVMAFKVD